MPTPSAETPRDVPLFRIAVKDPEFRWCTTDASGTDEPLEFVTLDHAEEHARRIFPQFMAIICSGPPFMLPSASPADADTPEVRSRSVQRREAAQRGEPQPVFSMPGLIPDAGTQEPPPRKLIGWRSVVPSGLKDPPGIALDKPEPVYADAVVQEPLHDWAEDAAEEIIQRVRIGGTALLTTTVTDIICKYRDRAAPRSTPSELDEDVRVCELASGSRWEYARHMGAIFQEPEHRRLFLASEHGDGEFAVRSRTRFPQVVRELQSSRTDLARLAGAADESHKAYLVACERADHLTAMLMESPNMRRDSRDKGSSWTEAEIKADLERRRKEQENGAK